jgi:hypothetical protein
VNGILFDDERLNDNYCCNPSSATAAVVVVAIIEKDDELYLLNLSLWTCNSSLFFFYFTFDRSFFLIPMACPFKCFGTNHTTIFDSQDRLWPHDQRNKR